MVITSQKITNAFSQLAARFIEGSVAPAACGTHVGIEESLLASRLGFRVSVVYVNDVVNNSEEMYVCLALCSVL